MKLPFYWQFSSGPVRPPSVEFSTLPDGFPYSVWNVYSNFPPCAMEARGGTWGKGRLYNIIDNIIEWLKIGCSTRRNQSTIAIVDGIFIKHRQGKSLIAIDLLEVFWWLHGFSKFKCISLSTDQCGNKFSLLWGEAQLCLPYDCL